jgi:hypothetical protein
MGPNIDNLQKRVVLGHPYLCQVASLKNDASRFHDQG